MQSLLSRLTKAVLPTKLKIIVMDTLELIKEQTKKQVTTTISGGEAVLEACLAEGVETIFGYPGGAIMPIYDALYDYKEKLKHILVRHEQGAIHAAQGFARESGRTGVVSV